MEGKMKYATDGEYVSGEKFFGDKWELVGKEYGDFLFKKSSHSIYYFPVNKMIEFFEDESEEFSNFYSETDKEFKLFIQMVEKYYPEVLL